MNEQAFKAAYNLSRNGANAFYTHWFDRKFQYSDGVRDCLEAGCYWLLDIAATELPAVLRKAGQNMGTLAVKVEASKARLTLDAQDGAPPLWARDIEFTDLPQGEWIFFIADEGERVAMILPTEY